MGMTNYGLSALASAIQGSVYVPPLYLVIENNGSTLSTALSVGSTAVVVPIKINFGQDNQLVLGTGLPTQETVTYSSVTGSGPYTYHLTGGGCVNAHLAGDPVCRVPLATDSLAEVVNELEYDATNFPGQRIPTIGGYSQGTGQWTMQFFISGIQASSFLMTIGLSDNANVGSGNLHYHQTLGVNHVYNASAGGVDLEIDIPISLTGS